jgi:hypothetical protein
MLRGHRLILGALALLGLSAPAVDAQFYPYGAGWGGYGFGGWGGTADGDIARGMGAFVAAEGTYNYDTAVADSINANTLMGVNQYLYNSTLEAGRLERLKMARRKALVDGSQASAQKIADQIRDNPTEADIESGAALNAILDQLSHPSVLSGSSLRMANTKLDSKLVRAIPFRDNTDAVTIALDQLTDEKAWPLPLRDPAFAPERDAYVKAVDDALAEDKEGDLTPATIAKVRGAIANLSRRVGQVIPKDRQPDHLQATNYIKGLAGFSRMLEKANVDQVLAGLEKIDQTTVGNLIAFMHTYNLRFGPATTPHQRDAYRQLYPIMVNTRDRLLGKPGEGRQLTAPGNVNPAPPTALFHGIDDKHLHAPPTPPTPGTVPR